MYLIDNSAGPGWLDWRVGDPLEDVCLVTLTRCKGAVQPVRTADAALTCESLVTRARNTRITSLFTRGTRAARAVSTRGPVTSSELVMTSSFSKGHDYETKNEFGWKWGKLLKFLDGCRSVLYTCVTHF